MKIDCKHCLRTVILPNLICLRTESNNKPSHKYMIKLVETKIDRKTLFENGEIAKFNLCEKFKNI